MPRKSAFSDFDDDGVNPLGPKRPLEFLAPTLRLMAPGSSILISKAPEKDILKIAQRIGAEIELKPEGRGLRLDLIKKPPISPPKRRWDR